MPIFDRSTRMMIRLSRRGCTNRPFYHIVVMKNRQAQHGRITEQIGSYDPLHNFNNERIIAINYDRLRWWISRGAQCSKAVEIMLGLGGYFPIHPVTRLEALRIQRKSEEATSTQPEQISSTDTN